MESVLRELMGADTKDHADKADFARAQSSMLRIGRVVAAERKLLVSFAPLTHVGLPIRLLDRGNAINVAPGGR